VRRTLGDLRPRLEAAGVDVECESAGGVTAEADREKLRQVLINLIENALDALSGFAGVRRLEVSVARSDGCAVVRVRDSGPGVPDEALARLFEPFFTLKQNGTGLGLAIARRTVEAHRGRIEVRSTSGTGLTFHLELPLSRGGPS
jgi:signal transduction histidine kinase